MLMPVRHPALRARPPRDAHRALRAVREGRLPAPPLYGQQPGISIQSQGHRCQAHECANEQAGRNDENQRQSNLCCQQRVRDPSSPQACSSVRVMAQRSSRSDRVDSQCRRRPADERGDHSKRRRDGERASRARARASQKRSASTAARPALANPSAPRAAPAPVNRRSAALILRGAGGRPAVATHPAPGAGQARVPARSPARGADWQC